MTCGFHLWGAADGLECVRTDDHTTGHIFAAAWCADGHDESEARACA